MYIVNIVKIIIIKERFRLVGMFTFSTDSSISHSENLCNSRAIWDVAES